MATRTRSLATLAFPFLLAACASGEDIDTGPGMATLSPTEVAAQAAAEAEAEAAAAAEAEAQAAQAQAAAAEPPPPPPPPMERRVTSYVVKKGDDLLEIARANNLGFLELKAANPGVDHWLPEVGRTIALPDQHITAITMDKGLLINLAQMRIFRFADGAVIKSYPLGIGREGLETPLGRTRVVRKAKNPTWRPTQRMREADPTLPAVVPPGPANPLGNRALYLDWPLYRIHGTNIPWGVGRRVSSGCIRMYPEDVEIFYETVDNGTIVEVVNQPVLAEWRADKLWLEVHPTADGWDALENGDALPAPVLTTDIVRAISAAAPEGSVVDWPAVNRAVAERRGYPVVVGGPAPTS